MSKKKNDGFNTPFSGLKQLMKKEAAAKKSASTQQPRASSKPSSASASDDERAFLDAMAGVAPVSKRHQLPVNVPEINARIANEEAEALAQLYDLVSERGGFYLTATDAAVEGSAPGVDQRLVSALRRGEYAFQARIDLQGMTGDAAKNAVDTFLTQSKREAKRCVLIIHGSGAQPLLASLRDSLTTWIDRGRMGKLALALCTARPQDGGVGAFYVLLRR